MLSKQGPTYHHAMDVRTINKCLDGTLGILPWCAVVEEVVGIDVVSVDETMSLRNQLWWWCRVFVVLRLDSIVAAQALPHPIQTSPCNRYMDNNPVLGKQKIKCLYGCMVINLHSFQEYRVE